MSVRPESRFKSYKSSFYLISLLLLISDLLVFYSSFYLATKLRESLIPYLGGSFYWPIYKPMVFLGMGCTVVIFYFNDLYPGYGKTAVKEVELTSKLLTMVFLFLGGTIFLLSVYIHFPRSVFIIAWLMSIVLTPGLRFLIRNRTLRRPWYGIPVLYATDGTECESTITALRNCRRMGWNPIAIYTLDREAPELEYLNLPLIQCWEEFLEVKSASQVEIVIFSAEDTQQNMHWLRQIADEFKTITLIIPYFNLGSLWVKPRDLEGHLGLEITYHLLDKKSEIAKRMVDIIGSIILLVILSPIMLILSLLILLESEAPVIYRQDRLGLDKKVFSAYKFRSMVKDADQKLDIYLENNPAARAEYKKHHKLRQDPRITGVGKFLRKYSLDELPQLWNVLRGEMSLIGPRSYLPSELDEIGDYSEIIFNVRPGMTGWWQVMGRHGTLFQVRLKMDEYYISNWSMWMDLYVFYKTFWVVIRGTGT